MQKLNQELEYNLTETNNYYKNQKVIMKENLLNIVYKITNFYILLNDTQPKYFPQIEFSMENYKEFEFENVSFVTLLLKIFIFEFFKKIRKCFFYNFDSISLINKKKFFRWIKYHRYY